MPAKVTAVLKFTRQPINGIARQAGWRDGPAGPVRPPGPMSELEPSVTCIVVTARYLRFRHFLPAWPMVDALRPGRRRRKRGRAKDLFRTSADVGGKTCALSSAVRRNRAVCAAKDDL
jgi:hypothetical protein